MRPLLVGGLVLLAACTVEHHITLLLGPDADTLTSGFTCKDPLAPNAPLLARGFDQSTHILSFSLVVDVIDLGDTLPGCLGEDVEAACNGGTCQLKVADSPRRACVELQIPGITDLVTAPGKVRTFLADNLPEIVSKAPHRPVMLRAVATMERCDDGLKVPVGDVWPDLDPTMALGCAYSCPVNLDNAESTIELGLGVETANLSPQQCTAVVQACAQFPEVPML